MSRATAHTTVRPDGRARLATAIEALAERDRLVLALTLLEGLTSLETAASLRLGSRDVEHRIAELLGRLAGARAPRRVLRRAA